jgi:putative transposase
MTAEHDLPIVRPCQVARLSRAAYYKPGVDRMARDAEVITALQAIVVDEQRWGFWKCHDRLRAQGYGWNHKRVWRVYCQLRLNLPRRTRRRVPHRERQPLLVEPHMNAVWALDFMRDTLYSGPSVPNPQRDRRSESRGLGHRHRSEHSRCAGNHVSDPDDRPARPAQRDSL